MRGMKLREVYDKYEYNSLIKVLGLEVDKIYTSVTELRYQSVILLMNRDNEGCRAVSQLFNFFAVFWPSLCQIDGFILLMILPLFRC